MLAASEANNLQINKDRLRSWATCSDGYRWFIEKFPGGGEFMAVYKSLIADKRGSDADWLVANAFEDFDAVTRVKQTVIMAGADAVAIAALAADGVEAATTGERANSATTGSWANSATTGNWSLASTVGKDANAATTGKESPASTVGVGAVAAALGTRAKARAGVGGAIVLAHRDEAGHLLGIRAAMVGQQGIKPDVWYELDDKGEFVKAGECAKPRRKVQHDAGQDQ
jgi:hypothetical protein